MTICKELTILPFQGCIRQHMHSRGSSPRCFSCW